MKRQTLWLVAVLGASLFACNTEDGTDDNDFEFEGIQEPGSDDLHRRGCGTQDLDELTRTDRHTFCVAGLFESRTRHDLDFDIGGEEG